MYIDSIVVKYQDLICSFKLYLKLLSDLDDITWLGKLLYRTGAWYWNECLYNSILGLGT